LCILKSSRSGGERSARSKYMEFSSGKLQ